MQQITKQEKQISKQEIIISNAKDIILKRFLGEVPNKNLAILAMIFMIIVSFICLLITLYTKTWFMLLVPLTGFLIALGYYFRILMINNPKLSKFVWMEIFIIVPPLLLAAANYHCFKLASNSILFPMIILVIDILCLLIQSIGVYLFAHSKTDINKKILGIDLVLISVITSVIINILFIFVIFLTNKSLSKNQLWICLYITMIAILIRNIFRLIEFLQNKKIQNNGYLSSHEEYLYLFDFMPIFISIIVCCILNYGFYL